MVHRRRNLSAKDFVNVLIPLPPLPEQRKIAHVLSTIQRAIELQNRIIAAARELKRSLMRHLFTYGPVPVDQIDRVLLKETEIGPVPEHWEVLELGKLSDVKGGKRLPKGHSFAVNKTPYPYIRVVDFKGGSVDLSNLKYLNHEDHIRIKNYTISSNDVYISIAGTIGLVGTIPSELHGANLTENAAKIVIKNHTVLDKSYLAYFLVSEAGQKQIDIRTTKTSQPKLALARIKQIPISLPPIEVQRQIVLILQTIEQKTEIEEKRKSTLQSLFQTMLHLLMTGKVRVKDLEVSDDGPGR